MDIKVKMVRFDKITCLVHQFPANAPKVTHGYPLLIGSCAQGMTGKPANIVPRFFEFFSISHMYKGKGFYWTPEEGRRSIEPGDLVVTTPGTVHSYGGDNDIYVEDAICFHGPLTEHMLKGGLIRNGIFKLGHERRLQPIIEKAMIPSPSAQISALIDLQGFFSFLAEKNKTKHEHKSPRDTVSALIYRVKTNPSPWWTVEEMAANCNLSLGHFRKIFLEIAGMSPKHYVEEAKVKKAMELLLSSNATVAEIGTILSYSDPFHFSRRFKKLAGVSPDNYRSGSKHQNNKIAHIPAVYRHFTVFLTPA